MSRFASPPDPQDFNERVWKLARQIPNGKVATYGHLALSLPLPPGVEADTYRTFGARWVGGAMAACPKDVPWWRVINSKGEISQRPGAVHQRELLENEGVIFNEKGRVDLKIYQWEAE